MNKLGFFTPIIFAEKEKSYKHQIIERIEDYFFLGNKKAFIIPGKIVNNSQEVEIRYIAENKTKKVILSAIKVISYMSGLFPSIMFVAKAIFRATHKFHEIPSVALLQDGIDIKPETVSKINSCMKNILKNEEKDGLKLFLCQHDHRVFSLDSVPGLIFKMKRDSENSIMVGDSSMKDRYQSMIDAKTVCRTYELGHLVIPRAKLFQMHFEGENYNIIAEEKVDIDVEESMQEKHYEDYADSLNEAIKELAVFIAHTGFSDVEWRNAPVLKNSLDEKKNRKIALIDIEEMKGADIGLLGGFSRRGLVCCVNEKQIDIVINEALKHGVIRNKKDAQKVKKYRLNEIESGKGLKKFYEKKGIINGKEPIKVDINSLGLDLSEKAEIKSRFLNKTVTLKEIVENVIKKINELIKKNSDQKSVKGKRSIYLNTNVSPFLEYNGLGLPLDKFYITKEEEKQRWLTRIIQSLIDKKHIFKLDDVNGHGYFIQA